MFRFIRTLRSALTRSPFTGTGYFTSKTGSGIVSGGSGSFILREDGSYLLREDGFKFIREAAAPSYVPTYYILGF
jgi:hypothetical protein